MSFRFQKRVRVAPGLRLNISKRGVSTSFGKRGASVTLGRTGLYGNVGIPGSGLSYRTKLDKQVGSAAKSPQRRNGNSTPKAISLSFDKDTRSLVFVDEKGEKLHPSIEKQVKRDFADDIQKAYGQKEDEMNEHTTRLLKLHKETLPKKSTSELKELAESSISFDIEKPNQKEIFEELKLELLENLTFFQRLSILLPQKRKEFLAKVEEETNKQFSLELEQFQQAKETVEETKEQRMLQVDKVINGDISAMEHWLETFLADLDFPLETNVSFTILSSKTVYLDVDLPQMEEVPLTKTEILKSGKLKIQKKSQRELREHYAIMIGGTALYLCSFVFSLLPTCETVIISGYTQVKNKATGHIDDQYIYSLKVNHETFYTLNIAAVHPIAAFENFQPIMNATKTFIFREITPYEPECLE